MVQTRSQVQAAEAVRAVRAAIFNIEGLPNETILQIISYLDDNDLLALEYTSRQMADRAEAYLYKEVEKRVTEWRWASFFIGVSSKKSRLDSIVSLHVHLESAADLRRYDQGSLQQYTTDDHRQEVPEAFECWLKESIDPDGWSTRAMRQVLYLLFSAQGIRKLHLVNLEWRLANALTRLPFASPLPEASRRDQTYPLRSLSNLETICIEWNCLSDGEFVIPLVLELFSLPNLRHFDSRFAPDHPPAGVLSKEGKSTVQTIALRRGVMHWSEVGPLIAACKKLVNFNWELSIKWWHDEQYLPKLQTSLLVHAGTMRTLCLAKGRASKGDGPKESAIIAPLDGLSAFRRLEWLEIQDIMLLGWNKGRTVLEDPLEVVQSLPPSLNDCEIWRSWQSVQTQSTRTVLEKAACLYLENHERGTRFRLNTWTDEGLPSFCCPGYSSVELLALRNTHLDGERRAWAELGGPAGALPE